MSHTVTVTRTTTTSTTQAVLLNVGYLKSIPGILKVIHVVLGIITVALLGHYIAYHKNQYTYRVGPNYPHVVDHAIFIPELFFLLIATTCLITSTLLLFSCLISIAAATIIPKTVLEVVYHLVAAVLLIIAAIIYLVDIESEYKGNSRVSRQSYSGRLAAAEVTIFSPLTFLLFVASVHYLRCLIERKNFWGNEGSPPELSFNTKIFISVLGIINSIFYAIAVFFAHRNYKTG